MPFIRVDAYEGRNNEQVKELLDAIHRGGWTLDFSRFEARLCTENK